VAAILIQQKWNKKHAYELFSLTCGTGPAVSYNKLLLTHDSVVQYLTPFPDANSLKAFVTLVGCDGFRWWKDRVKCNPNPVFHSSFTAEDAIVLTLLALRRGLDNRFLAILFGSREQLVGDTLVRWICYLAAFLDRLCPDVTNEQVVQLNKLLGIKSSHITDIIDSAGLGIERADSLAAQSVTWSEYYNENCAKFLVSLAPCGYIRFVSFAYPGRISDSQLAVVSFLQDVKKRGAGVPTVNFPHRLYIYMYYIEED
jgi:hypothetical protein